MKFNFFNRQFQIRYFILPLVLVLSFGMVFSFQNCSGNGVGLKKNSVSLSSLSSSSAPSIAMQSVIPLLSNSNSLNITFRVTSSLSIKNVSCQLDTNPAINCNNLTASFTNIPDGDHKLTIEATDSLDQKAQPLIALFRSDTTAPTLSFSQTPTATTGSTSAAFTFSATDNLSGVKSLQCSLDGGAFANCVSPVNLTLLSSASHTFIVKATDEAGNQSPNLSYSWVVNTSLPILNITQKPNAIINSTSTSFSFNGTDSGAALTVFECQIDAAAFAACTSPKAVTVTEGQHTFNVRGKTATGNFSSVSSVMWKVDTTAPSTPILMSNLTNPTTSPTISFNFSSTDANGISSYQCALDTAAFATCTSPTIVSVAIGNHSYRVQSIDSAGNTSAIARYDWTVNAAVTTPSSRLAAAKAVLTSKCMSCHTGSGGITNFGLTSDQDFVFANLVTPGDLAKSKLIYRIQNYPTEILGARNMPQGGPALTAAEYSTLTDWVLKMTPVVPIQTFTCNPALVPKTSMMKLVNREYKNSINATLDSFSSNLKNDTQLASLMSSIESDILTEDKHYSREQYFLLTSSMTSSYLEVAFRAGALVAADATGLQNYPNTSQCLSAATITQACHKSFVTELSKRAFRKTLSATEQQTLANNLWDSTLSKANLIQMTTASILQMPDFLYRIYDAGATSTRGTNVLTLNAQEYASKISYLLTGAPPDSTLAGLADSGQLLNASIAAAQIDRLLATAAAKETIVRMFREIYGYEKYDSFTYSSDFLSGLNTTGLQNAMTLEMDNYFKDIIITQKGTFTDLMSSRASTLSSQTLADVYGVTYTSGQISLPANRAGFLNRAAILSKRSGTTTSPVLRGLNVIESVLCGTVPPPPPNVSAVIDPLPAGVYLTTRERFALKTEVAGTSCVSCHSRMNNVGYFFEAFDSIGRARTQERIFDSTTGKLVASLNINSSANTSELNNTALSFQDSSAFVTELSTNHSAKKCLVQKFTQFESRKPATENDGCKMNSFLNVIADNTANGGSIQQAIKAYLLSEDFKLWSY